MTVLDRVQAVRELHAEIDQRTAAYAREAQLSCPPGCGHCCENPDIQVTVLDCLPLAWSWVEAGQEDIWHSRLCAAEMSPSPHCPFYFSAGQKGRGRCTQYSGRMSLCRLFGYAAVRTKSGASRVAHCAPHNSDGLLPLGRSGEQLTRIAPLYSDYSMRMTAIDPTLGTRLLPAATAARIAIEYVVAREDR